MCIAVAYIRGGDHTSTLTSRLPQFGPYLLRTSGKSPIRAHFYGSVLPSPPFLLTELCTPLVCRRCSLINVGTRQSYFRMRNDFSMDRTSVYLQLINSSLLVIIYIITDFLFGYFIIAEDLCSWMLVQIWDKFRLVYYSSWSRVFWRRFSRLI